MSVLQTCRFAAVRVETTQVETNETRIEDGLSVSPEGENEFHELGSLGVPVHVGAELPLPSMWQR